MTQLEYTISEIYRLADTYRNDVAHYNFKNVYEVFDAARSIPYRRDNESCGYDECIKRPLYGRIEGDCDDKTVFAGAAFNLLGVPWRVVTTSYRDDGEMQHVYPEVMYAGRWMPFDATYSGNTIFRERPYTAKLIWNNPMTVTERNNVASLEGVSGQVGLIPAAVLGELSTISSILGSIGDTLASLPIVGGLFKGRTQHVNYDEAVTTQQQEGAKWSALYQALDASGKALLYSLAKQFYENDVLQRFRGWWDDAIAKDYATWGTKGFLATEQASVYSYMSLPIFYFLTLEDKTRVQETIPERYIEPVQRKVKTPLEAYVKQKYNVNSLEEFQQQSSVTNTIKENAVPIVLAAGALLLLFTRKGKARR